MPTKRYVVTLTADERTRMEALARSGKQSARTIIRARILLLADQGGGGPAWEDPPRPSGAGTGRSSGSGSGSSPAGWTPP
jgi:hypothetical protein